MAKSATLIVLLLTIFTFSVSSGVSRACCWDMDKSEQQSETVKSDDEPCHTQSENTGTNSKENPQEPTDCCYNMVECQLQLIKISKAVSIQPLAYVLLNYSSIYNFNSNIVEPLKHPPKVLL